MRSFKIVKLQVKICFNKRNEESHLFFRWKLQTFVRFECNFCNFIFYFLSISFNWICSKKNFFRLFPDCYEHCCTFVEEEGRQGEDWQEGLDRQEGHRRQGQVFAGDVEHGRERSFGHRISRSGIQLKKKVN